MKKWEATKTVDKERKTICDGQDTWTYEGGPWGIPSGYASNYRFLQKIITIAGIRENQDERFCPKRGWKDR